MARKIYTRRGDRGETRLLSGESVGKDDLRVKTYGTLDELQCHMGMARSLLRQETVRSILYAVQRDLFVAGSELATSSEKLPRLKKRLGEDDVTQLERWIDEFTSSYGLPRHFVVPGASPESAQVHIARAVCRRCERYLFSLNRQTKSYSNLMMYLNRLGDLLFVIAWALQVECVVREVVAELISAMEHAKEENSRP